MKDTIQCPVCGSSLSLNKKNNNAASTVIESIPASSATIDITANATGEEMKETEH